MGEEKKNKTETNNHYPVDPAASHRSSSSGLLCGGVPPNTDFNGLINVPRVSVVPPLGGVKFYTVFCSKLWIYCSTGSCAVLWCRASRVALGHFRALWWLRTPSRTWQILPMSQVSMWMWPSQGRAGGQFYPWASSCEAGLSAGSPASMTCSFWRWCPPPLYQRFTITHPKSLMLLIVWGEERTNLASANESVHYGIPCLIQTEMIFRISPGFGFVVDTFFSLRIVCFSLDQR